MKIFKFILLFSFVVFVNNVAAYGSSSSKKACKKPKFSEFSPPHLSSVGPESEFSFTASGDTLPNSIKVTVKKMPVDVEISEKNSQFLIKGKLPAELQNAHARISIQASSKKKCRGTDGWLLKINNE
jgi:hypothetical protein